MKHRRLGRSGLKVSELVLGCMSYGDPARGVHSWTKDWGEAKAFFAQAIEAGVTTFDTADIYSAGTSEELTGRACRELARRDEVVIATKVFSPMGASPHSGGLSRKHVMAAADGSLRRLGTDHIDLYQIHSFDDETPVEETMEALHDLVRSGKVRYLGACNLAAWQLAKMQTAAMLGGWTPFVSVQVQYNLLHRDDERELHRLCIDQDTGILAWSPLARGRLARDWGAQTERSENDEFGKTLYRRDVDVERAVVTATHEIARERGVPAALIALAWVRQRPGVTAPIVGATRPGHLADAIASLEIDLVPDELARLDAGRTEGGSRLA